MIVHLVYGLFLLQFVLGVSLFHLDYFITVLYTPRHFKMIIKFLTVK